MDDFETQINRFDLALFRHVLSQTSENDKRSLLALQRSFRETLGDYVYLEIGSYKGGSLQTHVVDPHCTKILSIDPRPRDTTQDERGDKLRYWQNTTQSMIDGLKQIPGADLAKLVTFESGTDQLAPASVQPHPDFCFVDGEHTDAAALRDARFCLAVMKEKGCIAFHDANIVYRGIAVFLNELKKSGRVFRPGLLADTVFYVELGEAGISQHPPLQKTQLENYPAFFWGLGQTDVYRDFYNHPLIQKLRYVQDRTWGRGVRLLRRIFTGSWLPRPPSETQLH